MAQPIADGVGAFETILRKSEEPGTKAIRRKRSFTIKNSKRQLNIQHFYKVECSSVTNVFVRES